MPWKEFQNNQTRRTHFGPKRPKRECQINMDNKESDEKKSKGRKQEKGSVHTVHLLAQRLRAKRRMAAWRPGDGKEEEEKVKTSFVCSSQSLFCRHIKRKSSAPWHFLTLSPSPFASRWNDDSSRRPSNQKIIKINRTGLSWARQS